jgi:hypothetical protein
MADMYGAKGSVGGIVKGTQVALTLGKGNSEGGAEGGGKGSLTQNLTLTYTRNVTRIWELGSNDTYYIVGHTEGQAGMSRIVAKIGGDILDDLADPCTAKDNVLVMSSIGDNCDTETNVELKLTASGPILTQRSFSAEAGRFIITDAAAIMFSGLEKG